MATVSSHFDVLKISSAPVAAQPSSWATKQDWTRHEDLIRRLYGQRTLPDVMQEMKSRHGFKATIKMYKMRINQWGLRKKKTQCKIRAIARKNKPEVTHQKRSLTHLNDSNDGYEDVIRHEKRRRMADNVIAPSTALTNMDVVNASPQFPPPLLFPSYLALQREYSAAYGTITKGPSNAGVKVAKNPSKYLYALLYQCTFACRLFANNHGQEAGQALIIATAGIKNIVEAEYPMTLTLLFRLLLKCQRKQRHGIALAILRQFSAFGKLLLGDVHPLGRICGWLASVNESHFEEVVLRCFRSTGDQFEANLGPMHRSTVDSRWMYSEEVCHHSDLNQKELLQQSLLEKCERTLGAQDMRIWDIRSLLAFRCLERKDYTKAKKMGKCTLAHDHQAGSPSDQIYLRTKAQFVLAIPHSKLRKYLAQACFLRQVILLRQSEWGVYDSRAGIWSEIMEKWLLKNDLPSFGG